MCRKNKNKQQHKTPGRGCGSLKEESLFFIIAFEGTVIGFGGGRFTGW